MDKTEIIFLMTSLLITAIVMHIVFQTQINYIEKYCQELVNNGTINNISNCNITMRV